MPSQRNVQIVDELVDKLKSSSFIVSTGFQGVDVSIMTDFRRHLRQKGLEYRVIKNTLIKIAADRVGIPQLDQVVTGSTGVVLGNGDPVEMAKALIEYLKTSRAPITVQGALSNGSLLSSEEVNLLSALPPIQTLAGQLIGTLVGVLGGVVNQLNAPPQMLVTTLNGPAHRLVTVLHGSTSNA